jgi:hypothetical protein
MRRSPLATARLLGAAVAASAALAATVLPLPSAGAATTGHVYVVSTSGSDSNAGTQASPWRTLKKGLTSLYPGDTLEVRGGDYTENLSSVTTRAGTSTAPVTVMAYPGERPVLHGLLWLRGISYWTLDGLNVTWDSTIGTNTDHMVKITNGVGWTLKNSELWGAHSYAALLVAGTTSGQPANWTVTRNCLHDTYATNNTNQDHLIYANTGTSAGAGTISHNVMFNATNGEAVKLGGATATSGGGMNTKVAYNTMYNAAQTVLISWQSAGNSVYGNIMGGTYGSYGTIRGYQLASPGNEEHNNWAYAAKSLLLNDSGYAPVTNNGGNVFPQDPQFDSKTSCSGFHPMNTAAQAYGAYSTAG